MNSKLLLLLAIAAVAWKARAVDLPLGGKPFYLSKALGTKVLRNGLAYDGAGLYLLAWSDGRNGPSYPGHADLYATRIKTDGTVMDPEGIPVANRKEHEDGVTTGFVDGLFVVSYMELGGSPQGGYLQRVSANGTLLDPGGSYSRALTVNTIGAAGSRLMLAGGQGAQLYDLSGNEPTALQSACMGLNPDDSVMPSTGIWETDAACDGARCAVIYLGSESVPLSLDQPPFLVRTAFVGETGGFDVHTIWDPQGQVIPEADIDYPQIATAPGDDTLLYAWGVRPRCGTPSVASRIRWGRVGWDGVPRDARGFEMDVAAEGDPCPGPTNEGHWLWTADMARSGDWYLLAIQSFEPEGSILRFIRADDPTQYHDVVMQPSWPEYVGAVAPAPGGQFLVVWEDLRSEPVPPDSDGNPQRDLVGAFVDPENPSTDFAATPLSAPCDLAALPPIDANCLLPSWPGSLCEDPQKDPGLTAAACPEPAAIADDHTCHQLPIDDSGGNGGAGGTDMGGNGGTGGADTGGGGGVQTGGSGGASGRGGSEPTPGVASRPGCGCSSQPGGPAIEAGLFAWWLLRRRSRRA